MKQLLLHSLLIFGSAFAFIKCAQWLTLNDKIPGQHLHHTTNINNTVNKQNEPARPVSGSSNTKFNFEDNAVRQFLEKSPSLNVMGHFDFQTLFYYQNMNFTSFDLLAKYPNILKHDKSK